MPRTYWVQSGDTVGRIARQFGVNAPALLAANPPIAARGPLVPGTMLAVPDAGWTCYMIQQNDSVERIAGLFRTRPEDIFAHNPGLDPSWMPFGQVIRIPRSLSDSPGWVGEYGYRETLAAIDRLRARYPSLSVYSIGRSVRGRGIPALQLGRGPVRIQYNAAFHANEWITSALLMRFLESLLEDEASVVGAERSMRSGAGLLERVTLWIVPIVNPDGVELAIAGADPADADYDRLLAWNRGSRDFSQWKANLRGVDLNDQFPAHWEAERDRRSRMEPGPRDYGGEAPLSEPEARALHDFTASMDFHAVMALHTQGEEIYWNYRDCEPLEAHRLAARLAAASGYRAVKLSGSDAGFKDWFIQAFGRPGFTVEAGLGSNPLPMEQFEAIYGRLSGLLREGLTMMAENSSSV